MSSLTDAVSNLNQRVGALETTNYDDSSGIARIAKIYGNVKVTTTVTASLHQYGLVAAENSALSFDGVNDYVNVPYSASINITGALTMEVMVYIRSFPLSSEANFIDKNSYNQFRMGLTVAGELHTTLRLTNGVTPIYFEDYGGSRFLPSLNTWYHFSLVFDPAALTVSLYINGALSSSRSVTAGYSSIVSSATNLNFGCSSSMVYADCIMDEFRIWNIARTQSEIQANMSNRLRGDESGLVGYWNFDEGSGTVALDKTANANHGTISGATYVGRNLALSFDGVSNYTSIADQIPYDTFTAITIECLVKPNANKAQVLVSRWNNSTPDGRTFYLGLTATGQINVIVWFGAAYVSYTIGSIPIGVYSHISFSASSSGNIKVYINSSLVGTSVTLSTGNLQKLNTVPTLFGKHNDGSISYFNGSLDDVRIWNIARTQAEIQANMNKRLTGTEVGLVGYWKFDEASLTTALDSTLDRYTNILGTDGSCENLTPFTTSGTAPILSATQKRSGSSSIKFQPVAAGSYCYKDYATILDTAKQYVFGAWVYVESVTSGIDLTMSLRDVGTFTTRYSVTPNTTTLVGSWQFIYVKIPTGNTLVGSGFRLYFGDGSAVTIVSYWDEIRLYELSAADYAAIGTTYTNATSPSIDDFIRYGPRTANDGTISGALSTRSAPFQEVVSFTTPIASSTLMI